MHHLKKLLIAIDFSPMDDEILPFMEKFSQALLPDEITLFHVVPTISLPESVFESPVEKQDYIEQHTRQSEEYLHEQAEKYFGHRKDARIKVDCWYGSPLKKMLEYIEENRPDLVVFGKKKLTGGSGILATKLARRVTADLLLIPAGAVNKMPVKRLLIPTDFSAHATNAVKLAIELHPLLKDPDITLLHAYEVPPTLTTRISRSPKQFDEMVHGHVEEAMKKYVHENIPDVIEVDPEIVRLEDLGPARQILASADSKKADLIIVGAEGHSLLETLFIGSVTEKLMRLNESIPILVIRSAP